MSWRTPSGESTFGQNNRNLISLILTHWMVIYLLGCAIQHLNNWSQCCLAMLHVPVSKTTATTTQRTQKKKTRKQGFKDECMFRLLAIHPFVAAINYIVFEGNNYYCIKICCNQFIQIKVYRVYCAHNVSLENVQHYCIC